MTATPRLEPVAGERIFTIAEFLSPEECRELIAFGESEGFGFATVAGEAIPSFRNNSRVNFVDTDRANALWERARHFLPDHEDGRRPLGFKDHLKFYRYEPGEHFDWHSDGIVPFPDGTASAYTFLVYLNDDCEGGETSFRNRRGDEVDTYRISPRTGAGLGFEHRILHRGETVTAGRKYVLRTDVIYEASGE